MMQSDLMGNNFKADNLKIGDGQLMAANHKKTYRLIGVGNVLVDRQITLASQIIKDLGFNLNSMTLIDAGLRQKLANKFVWQTTAAGGSVANSLATMAMLSKLFQLQPNSAKHAGHNHADRSEKQTSDWQKPFQVAFHGLAAEDDMAEAFIKSFEDLGGVALLKKISLSADHNVVANDRADVTNNVTGQCFCFIAEESGERTMATYLGVNQAFAWQHLEDSVFGMSDWVFLEGYLFDSADGKLAFYKIIDAVKKQQGKIALTLSDSFCVTRHQQDFWQLLHQGVDLVFANEAEITTLADAKDVMAAIKKTAPLVPLLVVTRSEQGVVVCQQQTIQTYPALKNLKVVDTTGAGDQLAAGFLFGQLLGWNNAISAQLGCLLAGKVITQLGARLTVDTELQQALAPYQQLLP